MDAVSDTADLLEAFGAGDAREREESWRYSKTALRALSQQRFVAAEGAAALPASLRERFAWPQTQGRRLVFVNGVFSPDASDLRDIRAGLEIRHDRASTSIKIASGCCDPLHLVHVSMPGASASRWQRAVDIEVLGGRVEWIEQLIGAAGSDVLGALTSTVRIHAGADVRSVLLNDLPDSVSLYRRVNATVGTQARYCGTQAILGGRLQRLDLNVVLAGERAGYRSRGVFALRGRQHADVHLDVRHQARDTASDALWRGVADQRARGIFHGAITVAPGADGSDAKLSNKNLLLSAQAEIDTQPVLEIHADEVKAAHGAAVGQIDERALFYLRSRGIALVQARRMLVAAFCAAALDQSVIRPDVRERISSLLALCLT
ncbi:MAG: SufD family Fe-S cluster assembly protein [Rhodanobacter sp.]|jgi:Fe-S cluster assembly protein SufD|nr:SufD family Fe-S cluster assembly protein [Rhodanobacter sp.]